MAKRLAEIKGLPSIDDLDALRIVLFEEMVESGKITRFPSTIAPPANGCMTSTVGSTSTPSS